MRPGGFEHPGFGRVGDDEGVVITKLAIAVAAAAALAMLGDQVRDEVERFARRRRAFEPQAQQVHAGQSRLRVRQACEDRLVADGDAVFVSAHLGAPHPERAADDDLVGPRRLRDFQIGALQAGRRVKARGQVLDELRFARLAVAILGEPERAVGSVLGRGYERVTHRGGDE